MAEIAAFLALWLVTYLLHSTLLFGLAWLIERLGRLRAPAARECLWRAALLGALLTASVQSVGLVERVPLGTLFAVLQPATAAPAAPAPSAQVPAVQAPAASAPRAGDDSTGVRAAAPMTLAISATFAPPAISATAALSTTPGIPAASATNAPLAAHGWRAALRRAGFALAEYGAPWLAFVWLAGAMLGALRLFSLGRLARRELAQRFPADAALAREFRALCAAHGASPPVLSVAPALSEPVSLPNGEIVVPPWIVTSLDARQRHAMLAHELAHQVRRDPQRLVLALGLHALLWLQPLHGLARRRLASLAELQADAWAARAVDDPRAVAECLAECAGHVTHHRVALFGAAMAGDSLLVERVDRLLRGLHLHAPKASWRLRGGVAAALVAGVFLFPGCDVHSLQTTAFGSSTSITVSGDGATSVTVKRPDYYLQLEAEGKATFTDDESDVATLERGGTFELTETLDGVTRAYTVKADRDGVLARTCSVDGTLVPMDDACRQWLAQALPRMFRESGLDAEARVARLLARGGPERVLAEVDLATGNYAKATYLGALLGSTRLDTAQTAAALEAAAKIDSNYELHNALSLALKTQDMDAPRMKLLLQAAGGIDSNYERAELLVECAKQLPDDAETRAAWLAASARIDSDYDMGRTLDAGLARAGSDAGFTAATVALAAEHMESDYSLGEVLKQVTSRAADPQVADAYLAAAGQLDSNYERGTALVSLLEAAPLDLAGLRRTLDLTDSLGSDYEKNTVLKVLAPRVAADPDLNRRYREVASTMSNYERGVALLALDDATQR